MNKTTMWIIVIVALIVGFVGGFFIANSQASKSMMMVKEDMQKQINDAKMENEKMMEENSAGDDKMMQDDSGSMEQSDTMMQDDKMMEK